MIDQLIQDHFSELMAGVHPAAEIFPLPTDEELEAICKSFREQGQNLPIIVDAQSRLLIDGRSRLLAAHRTQMEPKVEYRMIKDPWGLSLAMNLDRRHLTNEQKKVLYIKVREARGVRLHGSNQYVTKVHTPNGGSNKASDQSFEAEALGVGLRTVQRWESDAKVLDAAPDMKQAVIDGDKSVRDAVTEALLRDKDSEIARLRAERDTIRREKEATAQRLINERDREKTKRQQAEALTKASDRDAEAARIIAQQAAELERLKSLNASQAAQLEGGLGVAELLEPKVVIQRDPETERQLAAMTEKFEEMKRLRDRAVQNMEAMHDASLEAQAKLNRLEKSVTHVESAGAVLEVFIQQTMDLRALAQPIAALIQEGSLVLDQAALSACLELADRLQRLVDMQRNQQALLQVA